MGVAAADAGPTIRDPETFDHDDLAVDLGSELGIPEGAEVLVGDWDGDGRDTIGWRVGNELTFLDSLIPGAAEPYSMTFGRAGQEVVVGDWNGDGRDTVGLRDRKDFRLIDELSSDAPVRTVSFGNPNDAVYAGSFGAGAADGVAVRRGPRLLIDGDLSGGKADSELHFGHPKDSLLIGDVDGDGRDDVLVRAGDRLRANTNGNRDAVDLEIPLESGFHGRLVLGDWNGDGVDTVGYLR